MGDASVQSVERAIGTIAEWLLEGRHVVAFTGAGISTDSGVPDFRGPDGVWTRRDAGLPPPSWSVRPDEVRPNSSHLALADLQRRGRLAFLITQNTDGLHLDSGLDPRRLAELHGNDGRMRCLGCDRQFPRGEVGWGRKKWGPGYRTDRPRPGQPVCPACGGRLVSSVVNFGDRLPDRELLQAAEHARTCDLMLVLGSSLVVTPAASLVGIAVESGARVVLVNRGETPYDGAVALRVPAGIGDVLPPAIEIVQKGHTDWHPRGVQLS